MTDHVTEDYTQYRALSVLAVTSLVLGLLSITTCLAWALALIPTLGVISGFLALHRIRSNPQELSGRSLALAGVAASFAFLALGYSYLTYDYVTEVPPGFERISYAELQPDPDVPGEIYPPEVTNLDGKQVFIKGYVYPGKQDTGIKQFILCRDNGDCCFGGQPRLTDRIQVTLKGPLSLNYSKKLMRLAGTFHFAAAQDVNGLGGVIYHLDAEYLK